MFSFALIFTVDGLKPETLSQLSLQKKKRSKGTLHLYKTSTLYLYIETYSLVFGLIATNMTKGIARIFEKDFLQLY